MILLKCLVQPGVPLGPSLDLNPVGAHKYITKSNSYCQKFQLL